MTKLPTLLFSCIFSTSALAIDPKVCNNSVVVQLLHKHLFKDIRDNSISNISNFAKNDSNALTLIEKLANSEMSLEGFRQPRFDVQENARICAADLVYTVPRLSFLEVALMVEADQKAILFGNSRAYERQRENDVANRCRESRQLRYKIQITLDDKDYVSWDCPPGP